MYLKLIEGNKTYISHFHHFVSAYATNEQTVRELVKMIEAALVVAEKTHQSQVVNQDNITHIFSVHPSGNKTLYRKVGHYEIIRKDSR